jgi:radical SAM superfamily enzyme with C-terminal helix-hairpin-helix motif
LSSNLYIYCEDNPVNDVDPSGTLTEKQLKRRITELEEEIAELERQRAINKAVHGFCVFFVELALPFRKAYIPDKYMAWPKPDAFQTKIAKKKALLKKYKEQLRKLLNTKKNNKKKK